MNKGLFITGTDTGVGKTLVACGLTRLLRSWGVGVGVMKPISTGDRQDALQLVDAAEVEESLDTINPQFFKAPLAPSVSASLERRRVDLEAVYRAYWFLQKKYDFLIVEGVGGVKVPLGESTYVLDLIQALRLPAFVVARATLGTLNHTLLTLDALDKAKIPVVGVLLNGGTGRTMAELTAVDALEDHTVIPVFGQLRRQAAYAKDKTHLAHALKRLPRLTKMLRRVAGLS